MEVGEMLAELRLRLLREMPWSSVNALAEEIYAALKDEKTPQDIPEGIKLTAKNGVSPIQIVDYGDAGTDIPLMQITRGNDVVNISFGDGALKSAVGEAAPEPIAGATRQSSSGGSVFAGQVVASLGSNRYTMAVYLSGRTRAATDVTVTQLEGDPAFPHEVGRWTFVLKEADGNYCMWIPVWGAEA